MTLEGRGYGLVVTSHRGPWQGLQLVIEGVEDGDERVGILWVFHCAVWGQVAY